MNKPELLKEFIKANPEMIYESLIEEARDITVDLVINEHFASSSSAKYDVNEDHTVDYYFKEKVFDMLENEDFFNSFPIESMSIQEFKKECEKKILDYFK